MAATVIVNLDNLVDDIVNSNVSVISANQAIVDAQAAVVMANTSASTATGKAIEAASKAAEASGYSNDANTSAIEAAGYKDIAEVKADEASESAANALNSEILAHAYKITTAQILEATRAKYDEFDDRYLGSYYEHPTKDNDGNPILVGALYFNINPATKGIYVWDGSMWLDPGVSPGVLLASANLGDVDDVIIARSNLSVDSSAEVNEKIYRAQLALGTMYTVTDNTEKSTLQNMTVGDRVYVADDGDSKWAIYLVTVIDSVGAIVTDIVIMDEDVYLNANTAAAIKSAYESNNNTNAYTDTEKSKLSSIENNATADQTAAEVPYSNTISGITATDVQEAIDTVVTGINDVMTATGVTSTIKRYDKILSTLDVVNMEYTDGNLTTVIYSGDNNSNIYYRDTLEYIGGNLVTVKHYYATISLVTESAITTLAYNVDGDLISATYMEN